MTNTPNDNTTTTSGNAITIQAVSGGICKSHPKSQIIKAHINSPQADSMLNPWISRVGSDEIVVLQVVNSHENNLLIEYMLEKDYDSQIGKNYLG